MGQNFSTLKPPNCFSSFCNGMNIELYCHRFPSGYIHIVIATLLDQCQPNQAVGYHGALVELC